MKSTIIVYIVQMFINVVLFYYKPEVDIEIENYRKIMSLEYKLLNITT